MGVLLKDRVAVITGAGGGIGSAEAVAMAAQGAKVVENVIWKDGDWTPEELVKAVPEVLTAGREREKFPVALPLWLERMIAAEGITLDNLKREE